jgi:hypothetical protein
MVPPGRRGNGMAEPQTTHVACQDSGAYRRPIPLHSMEQ